MDAKINIAKILKDKPQGTKLWTDMFGSVTLYIVTDVCDAFQVKHHNKEPWFDKEGKLCKEGVLCIYPSKSMRDWSKFAWEKGDVLIRTNSEYCIGIFDEWTNDDYSTFSAKFINLGLSDNFSCSYTCKTEEWEKTENSKNYISEIERVMNGKLNLQTLEIQTQPEFKDGDIVSSEIRFIDSEDVIVETYIVHNDYLHGEKLNYYVGYNGKVSMIDYNSVISPENTSVKSTFLRYATEEEKKQLFDALAKERKAWNADKKMIIDLKPKWTPKPFDRVITRNAADDVWTANIFSHIDSHGEYVTIACVGGYTYCLPYNEETAKLIGTKNNWEG